MSQCLNCVYSSSMMTPENHVTNSHPGVFGHPRVRLNQYSVVAELSPNPISESECTNCKLCSSKAFVLFLVCITCMQSRDVAYCYK